MGQTFNRSSGCLVLGGSFGMCLWTCTARRLCTDNETTGVECDDKAWQPEKKREIIYPITGEQNLMLSVNVFLSSSISLMRHHFKSSTPHLTAASVYLLYLHSCFFSTNTVCALIKMCEKNHVCPVGLDNDMPRHVLPTNCLFQGLLWLACSPSNL